VSELSTIETAASAVVSPYRLYAEIAIGVVAVGMSIAWWVGHNNKEQNIGAQQCIEKTTETKQEATINVDAINQDHAKQLADVVQSYDAKLAAEHAGALSLADRLRVADSALRAKPLPNVAAAAGQVCSAQVDAATRQLESEHAESFAACLENQDEIVALRAAWDEQAKKGAPKSP